MNGTFKVVCLAVKRSGDVDKMSTAVLESAGFVREMVANKDSLRSFKGVFILSHCEMTLYHIHS